MAKRSTRDSLLEAGLSLMVRSGYNGTSVRDIVAAADAPLGSFGNHFRSKEEFALDVLDIYFERTRVLLREVFEDKSLLPLQQLRRYFDIVADGLVDENCNRGCLIGDFSLEMSCQNAVLRAHIAAFFDEWLKPFASCIAAAQAAGEIKHCFDPLELADFLLASWQGAILRMKVERNPAALDRFTDIIFRTFQKEQEQSY